MGVLVLGRETEHEHGLRPLDVLRDLSDIGRLVDTAFADDIAIDGSQFLNDLAVLTAVSPAMWLLRRISADMRDSFDGFVWVEKGKVVGNVTLTRDDTRRRVWTASNVAVHPDHRRRGIARALMLATIDAVADRGGGILTLQVKAANAPAYELYRSLGFVYVDGVTTLRSHGALVDPLPLASETRRVRHTEGRQLLELMRAAQSPLAGRVSPLQASDYVRSRLRRLNDRIVDFWYDQRRFWLTVADGERFVAAAYCQILELGNTTVDITVHPDADDRARRAIIHGALRSVSAPHRMVVVRVSSDQTDMRAHLEALEFSELRDLHRLMLEIDAPQ